MSQKKTKKHLSDKIDVSAKLPPDIHDLSLSLKEQVWKVLERYPASKPRWICHILQLPYRKNVKSVTQYKWLWRKRNRDFSAGLNRLNFHAAIYFGYVPKFLDRRIGDVTQTALDGGWKATKAKNRMIQWKDAKLGLIRWWETGRVHVILNKPYSLANQLQLVADAFFNSGLIFEFQIFSDFVKSLKQKEFSLTYDTGSVLPYSKIEFLQKSNGVTVITGDKSHPRSVEIRYVYPDWAERLELQHKQWIDFMDKLVTPKPLKPSNGSMIS